MQHTTNAFPWVWLAWLAVAALGLLFYRLWHSSGAESLRDLDNRLKKANSCITDLRQVNARLKSQNSTMRNTVNELNGKLERQMERFKELMDANTAMAGKLSSLTDQLAKEKELRDQQYILLTKTLAKYGELKP